MARRTVGSILKSKVAGEPDYIKLTEAIPANTTLSIETKQRQLESLAKAVAEGKLSEEAAEEIGARVEKIPDFVRAELKMTVKKN